MTYNPPEHPYHQVAARLKKSGDKILKQEQPALLAAMQDPLVASSPAAAKVKVVAEPASTPAPPPRTKAAASTPATPATPAPPTPAPAPVPIPEGLSEKEGAMWIILDQLSKYVSLWLRALCCPSSPVPPVGVVCSTQWGTHRFPVCGGDEIGAIATGSSSRPSHPSWHPTTTR